MTSAFECFEDVNNTYEVTVKLILFQSIELYCFMLARRTNHVSIGVNL